MKHKVILLHNHDNTWTPADLVEVAEDNRLVMEAMRSHGHEVTDVKVYHSVERALREKNYSPREWIVFNWCEVMPIARGITRGWWMSWST
jgi:hypothetical protein